MPKSSQHGLVWSSSRQTYTWHEGLDHEVMEMAAENSSWLGRVGQVSSFAFHGKNGFYTVCKEYKQRGAGYWYAYVRVKGKLTKRYLGRDSNLTFTHLEDIAQELWHDGLEVQRPKAHEATHEIVWQSKRPLSLDLSTHLLLATKLTIPFLRSQLVPRPRLLQRLQQGLERPLILISAPIGFGKSTLLSTWLNSADLQNTHAIQTAWLSLEPQDNEPERFTSYLLAALQNATPHLDMSKLLLSSSLEATLTLLINHLLQRNTPQEHLILVLDNYQVVTDEAIHQALSFLLTHLPAWMHLVLATREDPPLPLAHLRGHDDLLELRAADLRFTPEEAATFLIDVMQLPLSQEESALLQARTEGWITGLQLAAFSLQGRADVKSFITAFSGSHHYVVDYLLEEVLKQQSVAVQDFLLQTSILERLSASLCNAVRAQDNSQALLNYLEHANLFLVPLDDAGQWYRYHRLFAEALRQQLQRVSPDLVALLHQRANHWYKQQGLAIEATTRTQATPTLQSDQLTARESEVLRLLLDGASNKEIADELVLSMNTVKKHVLNICRKFAVRSRAQVIARMRTYLLP